MAKLSFHPHIASVYTEVQDWLSNKNINYRRKNIWDKIKYKNLLEQATLESAAAQYYCLFPAHFFKVSYTLEKVIGTDRILEWIKFNPKLCLVDVGCGAGSASTAFIDMLLDLRDKDLISGNIDLFLVGIDLNKFAIALYNQVMERLQSKICEYGINLDFRMIPEGDLEAISKLKDFLAQQRIKWGKPYLSQVLMMQVNVVSPFSRRYNNKERNYDELKTLGVNPVFLADYHQAFGREEASAYKQILDDCAIDHLHIITIGTEGWQEKVSEMRRAIDLEFSADRHRVERLNKNQEFTVEYTLPENCYWREYKNTSIYQSQFCVDVSTISNTELEDKDWKAVKDIQNSRLAWARTRHHFFDESMVDEIEIRLFEAELEENLHRLQEQLIAYAEDIAQIDDRIVYKFPKSLSASRPRALSRIEEEILSTALIQKLGSKVIGLLNRSYAYRFAKDYGQGETEYLYENWFRAYTRFINDARAGARKYPSPAIIRVDIKSFYEKIIQSLLVEITAERLTKSSRVEWLIRLLLSNELQNHQTGLGIVQGSMGSGFYANLYLLNIDVQFGANNEWDVELYRYVDDMIIIIPNPDHIGEILATLTSELAKLGLELNEDKTIIYDNLASFIDDTAPDEKLDDLQEKFDAITKVLWIMDENTRSLFRKCYSTTNEWWYYLEEYSNCLKAIGIFISETTLSRRIVGYLFNKTRQLSELKEHNELLLPAFPHELSEDTTEDWGKEFKSRNPNWNSLRDALHLETIDLFIETKVKLDSSVNLSKNETRRLQRRLRFAVNKLLYLGLADTAQEITRTICQSPWLLNDQVKIIEGLARQDFQEEMSQLLEFYTPGDHEFQEYMKAIVLRGLRFLPIMNQDIWLRVIDNSINGPDITSLMASETWLYVGQKYLHWTETAHFRLLKDALQERANSRLRKNYVLILGKFAKSELDEKISYETDYLRRAHMSAKGSDISSLFAYQEPDIIRSNYYSGRTLELEIDNEWPS
jgi:hypothetical protein